MDRRSFVKGCIAAAGVAGAAAAGISMVAPAIIPRPSPQPYVNYFGLHKVGGPAPMGVPLIPITVGSDGTFYGRPELNGPDGINILNWYKYCGHAEAAGLSSTFQSTNQLTYYISSDLLAQIQAQGITVWYADRIGQPIKATDLKPGDGAGFLWRSENQNGVGLLKGIIVRATRDTAFTPADPAFLPPPGPNGKPHYGTAAKEIPDEFWPTIRDKYLYLGPEGRFVAASLFCKHFCCVPGWMTAPFAKSVVDPINGGSAWDRLFCPCHGSIYHPFQLAYYAGVYQPDTVISPVGGT